MTESDYIALLMVGCLIIGTLLLIIKEYRYRCRVLENHIRYLNEMMYERYDEQMNQPTDYVKHLTNELSNDESKQGSD